VSAAAVHLYLGLVPAPAPRVVAEAFESLTVTQSDAGVSTGWQLVLRAERPTSPADDYPLVTHPLLRPFTRVVAAVSLGAASRVLLDGVITHIELQPSSQGQGALLTLTGDSVDTLMELADVTIPWPAVTDPVIVGAVLAKYTALGVVPQIAVPLPPPELPDPLEGVVVQNEPDAAFLRRLADPYGYVFFVLPGPVVGANTAYWGPPPRNLPPQKALSVDLGPTTNVSSLAFSYEAKGPTIVFGAVESEFLDVDVPVFTTAPTRLPPLAASPAITALLPFVRLELYANSAYGPGKALYDANAITQRSTDNVVTAQGSLDTMQYGDVLQAPGVVGVRGAGASYDGNYYVSSVTHNLRLGSYTQDFVLTREGIGTTTGRVNP
jgi:hypothetical protein